jgi:predicted DNA binding protein
MSLFGEFQIPANEFVFHETFQAEPTMKVEIERVVAADEILTPYFWISHISPTTFAAAAGNDPTIEQLEKLDEFEEATLYRADWVEHIETLVYAYMRIGAAILEAEGQKDEWLFRMRFDDREKFDQFSEFLNEEDVSFDLHQLYEITHPRTRGEFALTPKQYEAVTTAWEMGYFDLPRDTTMKDVADELNIAPQSLSDRLRRAQDKLIGEALRVDDSSGYGFSGVIG